MGGFDARGMNPSGLDGMAADMAAKERAKRVCTLNLKYEAERLTWKEYKVSNFKGHLQ